jgi:hypothetical protein
MKTDYGFAKLVLYFENGVCRDGFVSLRKADNECKGHFAKRGTPSANVLKNA